MSQDPIRIQAEFVVSTPSSVFHPGQIVIANGRITYAGEVVASPDIDLGPTVLLPGLINAHTHLEFSELSAPFSAGASFPDWIGQVVSYRRRSEQDLSPEACRERQRSILLQGLAEAYATGTFVVADIVSMPWHPSLLPSTQEVVEQAYHLSTEKKDVSSIESNRRSNMNFIGPSLVALPEIIGLTADRLTTTVNWAESLAVRSEPTPPLLGVGVSPHAPYSIGLPAVVDALDRVPRRWTAMHVAESQDELDWLSTDHEIRSRGAFQRSFERLGLPTAAPRPTVEDCIDFLAQQPRSLLIHGNFVTDAQAARMADQRHMSIVYCPRTHAHFNHPHYPLQRFQERKIRVVLGTDSRASNPDLDPWGEVCEARKRHTTLNGLDALAAVTSESAYALGIEEDFGTLEIGKVAAINTVAVQSGWTLDNLLDRMTTTRLEIRPLYLRSIR